MGYQKCRKCGIRYKKSELNKAGLCSTCEKMENENTQNVMLKDWMSK